MKRRTFLSGIVAAAAAPKLSKLDGILSEGIRRRKIPAVSAMVADAHKTLYTGAFGIRDKLSQTPVDTRSIFAIASMTKAITTAAAMQLIERGKLSLEDPIEKYLPNFANLQVLDQTRLRPVRRQPTLRHLLTHTAGFAYDNWNPDLNRYNTQPPPLMTDPGTRWEYGTNLDCVGRIIEVISGMSLEAYFQKNILQPLGMSDTSYILTPQTFARKVATCRRQPDGALLEDPYLLPPTPTSFNGGGGLLSTTADYVKFMQMILNRGAGVLRPHSVALMSANQIGTLDAGKMKTARPENSSDVDFHPGAADRFTFGFLLNQKAHAKGRSAGSLAWAGIQNTFYWIDPKRSLCAVIMMQFYPFCDREAMGLLREFEQAVY